MFKITNTNGFPYTGRYDGKDFTFPAGAPVYCPDDAARHIFGLGQQDKSAVLSRNGWATVTSGLQVGLDILNNFKFIAVEQVFDAPMADEIAHGPAPVIGDGGDGAADDAEFPPVDDAAATAPTRAGRAAR